MRLALREGWFARVHRCLASTRKTVYPQPSDIAITRRTNRLTLRERGSMVWILVSAYLSRPFQVTHFFSDPNFSLREVYWLFSVDYRRGHESSLPSRQANRLRTMNHLRTAMDLDSVS